MTIERILQGLLQPEEISYASFSQKPELAFDRVVFDRTLIRVGIDVERSFVLVESRTIHWLYRTEFVAAEGGTHKEELDKLLSDHPLCDFTSYPGSTVFEYESRLPWKVLLESDPMRYVQTIPHRTYGTYLKGLDGTAREDLSEPLVYVVCSDRWRGMIAYLIDRVRIFQSKVKISREQGEVRLMVSEVVPNQRAVFSALHEGVRVYLTQQKRDVAVIEPPELFQPDHPVLSVELDQLFGSRDGLEKLLRQGPCVALSGTDSGSIAGYVRKV